MEITPVRTVENTYFYYVKVNGNTLRLTDIACLFPKDKERIKDTFHKEYKNQLALSLFSYPNKETMELKINYAIKDLCKKMNLYISNNQKEQIQMLYRIYDYFSNNLKYDMLSMEERGNLFEDSDSYFKALKQSKDRLKERLLKLANIKGTKNYRLDKALLYSQTTNEHETLKNKTDKRELSYIKGLYNVFIRKVGVCSDFTNSFNYLLEQLNIPTYKLVLQQKLENGVTLYHECSLVELEGKKEKVYYGFDLTKSITNKNYNEKKLNNQVLGFGLGLNDILKNNTEILSIQKQLGKNEGRFFQQIEEHISKKNFYSKNINSILLNESNKLKK